MNGASAKSLKLSRSGGGPARAGLGGGEACAHRQTDIEGRFADLRADDGRRFFAVVAYDIRSPAKSGGSRHGLQAEARYQRSVNELPIGRSCAARLGAPR